MSELQPITEVKLRRAMDDHLKGIISEKTYLSIFALGEITDDTIMLVNRARQVIAKNNAYLNPLLQSDSPSDNV